MLKCSLEIARLFCRPNCVNSSDTCSRRLELPLIYPDCFPDFSPLRFWLLFFENALMSFRRNAPGTLALIALTIFHWLSLWMIILSNKEHLARAKRTKTAEPYPFHFYALLSDSLLLHAGIFRYVFFTFIVSHFLDFPMIPFMGFNVYDLIDGTITAVGAWMALFNINILLA